MPSRSPYYPLDLELGISNFRSCAIVGLSDREISVLLF